MVTVCPLCKTSICFNSPGHVDGVKIRCSSCSSLFRFVRRIGHGTSNSTAQRRPGCSKLRVVVASEQKSFCSSVAGILPEERFDLVYCHDGRIALQIISRLNPDAALIDVALPGMYGFEVCESVRDNPALASVKLVLIATVHDNRRYVRSPASLYGADAVIEPERLSGSLKQLIEELAVPAAEIPAAVAAEPGRPQSTESDPPAVSSASCTATDVRQRVAAPDHLSAEHKKAQRLARLIVSDIALYNPSLINEGVRDGNLFDLLADDVREANALFRRRVPEDVRNCSSYLDDAFSDLIARKRYELNCGLRT